MTKKDDVKGRLDRLRTLMDAKGLPHGVSRREKKVGKPLEGVVIREKIFPPGHVHGEVALDDLHDRAGRIFRFLGGDESFESFRLGEAVFLDTETTGLSGGAGTYAFLVGIGFFDERGFVVRQYLMPELSEEKKMLEVLSKDLEPFRSIVTYNGQAFDLPLLQTRYMMQGMQTGWGWEHHLDLLPVARRLWKGRFESCRLTCLEEKVVAFHRGGDIPGYAIPPLYVRFLKERCLALLEPVMTHNIWDIVTLAALAVSAWSLIERGESLDLDEGADYAAAAGIFGRASLPELSLACYVEALEHDLPEERRRAVFHGAAKTFKTQGRWDDAVALWEQTRRELPDDYYSRNELAKYFEHRSGDLEAALEAALEARKIVQKELSPFPPFRKSETRDRESMRRVERVREKIERLREKGEGE